MDKHMTLRYLRDPRVLRCTLDAQILYGHLLSLVKEDGHFDYSYSDICQRIFYGREINTANLFNELERRGLIKIRLIHGVGRLYMPLVGMQQHLATDENNIIPFKPKTTGE